MVLNCFEDNRNISIKQSVKKAVLNALDPNRGESQYFNKQQKRRLWTLWALIEANRNISINNKTAVLNALDPNRGKSQYFNKQQKKAALNALDPIRGKSQNFHKQKSAVLKALDPNRGEAQYFNKQKLAIWGTFWTQIEVNRKNSIIMERNHGLTPPRVVSVSASLQLHFSLVSASFQLQFKLISNSFVNETDFRVSLEAHWIPIESRSRTQGFEVSLCWRSMK